MNIQDLNYFHQLVLDQSFTKVAGHFHVSQPTITLAIKRLEKEFGAKLVERNAAHNDLSMTESGMQLYRHIEQILNEWQLAHQEIHALNEQVIRFGMSPAISSYFFPKVTNQLLKTGLLNHLQTYEDGSREVLRSIIDGNIDIGLVGSVAPLLRQQLCAEELKTVPFKIVVAPSSPLARKTSISFREATRYPFVVLNHHFANSIAFEQISRYAGVTPRIIYRTSNIDTLKRIVSHGTAISYIADLTILPGDPIVSIHLTDESQPFLTVMLVYRKTLTLSAHVQQFMNIIRKWNTTKCV
ncbi:LysR family transcriptional regulator [Sporolactobacillus sp. CPB3-1]|uniref:LysR family transcriptional regulator n=1 Tax=Sporolactobacillus mangiferae TaxID=2940498 RepID=A0ABT0M7I9_9BACL|nr:LysR family transcriptional regulator [Sporolactobacillus mangiferae]MCL1630568.1 LysR family transcriptional regulator [Sporolactobacillus mangiferae]